MKTRIARLVPPLLAMAAAFFSRTAAADEWYGSAGGYYTVQDQYGQILFRYGGGVYTDDEYISSDDKRYRIVEVDDEARRAVARFVEDLTPPEMSAESLAGLPAGQPTVAIYCTHSDESYTPTDGTDSAPEKGGILDVAAELQQNLERMGCRVVRSDTSHEPHDAGAYRRSRSTAMRLMKESMPDILCDIHRDAVPAEDYEKSIQDDKASRVRIVIGRSNQNKSANEEFARRIKKIADDKYPGLVKDIYIGKGTYNQDLMPQSVLLEVGTAEIDKQRAQAATKYLAEVIAASVGAGQDQSGGTAPPSQPPQGYEARRQSAQDPNRTAGQDRGAWQSILWIAVILAAVGGAAVLITVRRGQFKAKVGGFFREISGTGKKRGGDDPRNRM